MVLRIVQKSKAWIESLETGIPYDWLINKQNFLNKTVNDLVDAYEDDRLDVVMPAIQKQLRLLTERIKRVTVLYEGLSEAESGTERDTLTYLISIMSQRYDFIQLGWDLAVEYIDGDIPESHKSIMRESGAIRRGTVDTTDNERVRLVKPSTLDPLPVDTTGKIVLQPGYYNADWFKTILNAIPGVSFKVIPESKKVMLLVSHRELKLRLGKEVARLFDLPKGFLIPNKVYYGTFNLKSFHFIFVQCSNLSKSKNFLAIVSNDPGLDKHFITSGKQLQNGVVDKLEFYLTNEKGHPLENKGVCIMLELEIFLKLF